MITAGIIAEYNPFHNGHQYHIEETRRLTGADFVIAIMSGNFVQRGGPAIIDKYQRTQAALSAGCDLVLELPTIYSCSSAEFFASGAVSLLENLGVCDFLSFGSEKGNLEELSHLADILLEEPEEYRNFLKTGLKQGYSFPKARQDALVAYCKANNHCQFSNEFWDCLKESNNILALEYLKAIKKYNSSMEPVTIFRKNTSYHDKKLYEEISSATAIRHWILHKSEMDILKTTLPPATFRILTKAGQNHSFLDVDDLTPYLHQALLNPDPDSDILDLGEELMNRIQRLSWASESFQTITDALKNKQITETRVRRGLLHLILGLTKDKFTEQFSRNPAPYVKILGFRKESSALLKSIKANSRIPVITKPAHGKKLIAPEDFWVFDMENKADTLYQSMVYLKSGLKTQNTFTQSPIILP